LAADKARASSWAWVLAFAAAGLPAFVLRFSGAHLDPVLAALVFGMGIVGGAFLLSWAAEVAQLDVSASFAIAVLALVALLPEYTIEAVLAWDAGASFDPTTGEVTREMQRVAANVTGANRLLIGVGWSLVILIFVLKRRRALDLRGHMSLEIIMLAVATLVTFLIFFMGQVHIIVAAVLIALYIVYLWVSSRRESEEPELIGVALVIGSLSTRRRRAAVVLLFLYSAAVILVAAEPFVESLIETGETLGIDEFLLIQWIAPLASESPEIIVAVLFSLRANPVAGMTTLVSAEVNQLTVLVGSMVVIFSMSAGQPLSFLLDERQSVEFFLTSAVSVFAIVLIAPRILGWKAGMTILALFVVHLFFVDPDQRRIFAFIYLGIAAALVVADWRRVRHIFSGVAE
jgi:cation:H+ antiporter